jgi:hypothetical protein
MGPGAKLVLLVLVGGSVVGCLQNPPGTKIQVQSSQSTSNRSTGSSASTFVSDFSDRDESGAGGSTRDLKYQDAYNNARVRTEPVKQTPEEDELNPLIAGKYHQTDIPGAVPLGLVLPNGQTVRERSKEIYDSQTEAEREISKVDDDWIRAIIEYGH